jgi:hypothetical protein
VRFSSNDSAVRKPASMLSAWLHPYEVTLSESGVHFQPVLVKPRTLSNRNCCRLTLFSIAFRGGMFGRLPPGFRRVLSSAALPGSRFRLGMPPEGQRFQARNRLVHSFEPLVKPGENPLHIHGDRRIAISIQTVNQDVAQARLRNVRASPRLYHIEALSCALPPR